MKKGLALLLAASMTLSAFSSAALANDLTAEEKFKALVEAGIFTGFEDGSARLNENMTREQFAAVIVRLMGLDQVTSGTPTFSDVASDRWSYGYIEAAAEAGYINGMGDGTFAPEANVTIEQMAKILVEALDLEVDADAEVEGNVSDWARGYVAAAIEAGLIPASDDYTKAATREQLVNASYEANQVVNVPATLEVTATPTGAAKVELAFNKAIEADDATITIKKGSTPVVAKDITFAEDGKTATVEFSNSLAKGDYTATVSVEGEEEDATATFTITEERIAEIKFLTDYAVLVEDQENKVTVRMQVLNQYGEDITKDYKESDFEWDFDDVNESNANDLIFDPETGIITLTHKNATDEFEEGDTISAEVLYRDKSKDIRVQAEAELEIVDPAEVSHIEIKGLYNIDETDSTFSFDDEYSNWHLVVYAEDQYGHPMYADYVGGDGDSEDGLKLLNKEIDVNIDEEDIVLLNNVDDGGTGFEVLSIDGKDEIVLQFVKPDDADREAGTTLITLDANKSKAEIEVTVTDEVRIDTIELSQPASAPAGKKFTVPFVAYDLEGNEVWDADVLDVYAENNKDGGLNELKWDVDVPGGISTTDEAKVKVEFVENPSTGKAELVVDARVLESYAAALDDDEQIEIEIEIETWTEKDESIIIVLDDLVEPDSIVGLDDDFYTGYLLGKSGDLELEFVKFVDQYGNEIDDSEINFTNNIASPANGEYRVKVESSNENVLKVAGAKTAYLSKATDVIPVQAQNTKGSVRLTLELQKYVVKGSSGDWEKVNNASYSATVRVVELKDIKSFTATVKDAVYIQPAATAAAKNTNPWAKELVVEGEVSSGMKVFLPGDNLNTNYAVNISKGGVGSFINNGETYIYADDTIDFGKDDTVDTITVPIRVTIFGDGGPDEKVVEVTVSDKKAKTATLAFDTRDQYRKAVGEYEIKDGVLYVDVSALDQTSAAAAKADLDAIVAKALRAKDQYNVTVNATTKVASFYDVYTSNFSEKTRNSLDKVIDGDTFNVIAVAKDSGVTSKFKVQVVDEVK